MLIDGIVLLGVAVVIPLALGDSWRWAIAALAVAGSLVAPSGTAAAALAAVWLIVAAHGLVGRLRIAASSKVEPALVADVAAPAFACVAAGAFMCSRGNVSMFGIGEPIVQLTAVHFTYAGVGAVTLAGVVARTHRVAGKFAVAATVSAPPVVALGFLLEHPVPQVGGAALMAAGVFAIATLQLMDLRLTNGVGRPLLVVSSLAPWTPMVLAVAWAASNYADVPALSIPDMARTHGTMNAVFVVAGLLARAHRTRVDAHDAPTTSAFDSVAIPAH